MEMTLSLLKGKDSQRVAELIFDYVENITCLECCKYYVEPNTATCGHTLCHTCWYGRHACPKCLCPLKRKILKPNPYLQKASQQTQRLVDTFEELFGTKFDDLFNQPVIEMESRNKKANNVKDWLCNSENQFSIPPTNSQESTQVSQVSTSKIQTHTAAVGHLNPLKVIHKQLPQDDWDKIEHLPDSEDVFVKNKENTVGSMDIEPLRLDNNEYNVENPRRSSRKKEINDLKIKFFKKNSINDNVTDKKTNKTKQNWSNVKKMKKEFSKLNKQNKRKLNISIEMNKKTKSICSKPDTTSQKIHSVIEEIIPEIVNSSEIAVKAVPATEAENLKTPDTEILKENAKNKHTNNNTLQKLSTNSVELLRNDEKIPISQLLCNNNDITAANSDLNKQKIPFIKKSSLLIKSVEGQENNQNEGTKFEAINRNKQSLNNEDIEISIKIGSMITNIIIQKKSNNVQWKVNRECEIQTSGSSQHLQENTTVNNQPETIDVQNLEINDSDNRNKINKYLKTVHNNKNSSNVSKSRENITSENVNKTLSQHVESKSTKKNTESVSTTTANYEITESVEKEISKLMDVAELKDNTHSNSLKHNQHLEKVFNPNQMPVVEKNLNDLDIFYTDSVTESDIQLLKHGKQTPSEILMPTARSKKTQRKTEKRDREQNNEEELPNKKLKILPEKECINKIIQKQTNDIVHDTESITYDAIMSQVFANIDTDIENLQKDAIKSTKNPENSKCIVNNINTSQNEYVQGENNTQKNHTQKERNMPITHLKEPQLEKYSENVFSALAKNNDSHYSLGKDNILVHGTETQKNIDTLLTPVMCKKLISIDTSQQNDIEIVENMTETSNNKKDENELCTPLQDDDSDKSVVEETPQKNISFSKNKPKSDTNDLNNVFPVNSIIELSDVKESIINNENVTVLKNNCEKHTLETPLTINKFVDHVTHKSTPLAKKSLNFDKGIECHSDSDQTLCPTSLVIAKTTQEKEFMAEAFERTPSPSKITFATRSTNREENRNFCVAGSCLTPLELSNVKLLCSKYKWSFVDKYTKCLTHLVVGVDEEKRSQRSVKYMCALAANKWIVSYEWIEKCLQTKEIVSEVPYEALDTTGEPGPKRSRTVKQKLFQGITFYCMPPFSVLDVVTLKYILEAAGGHVVDDLREVRVTEEKPAFLLAEPEQTQEDRFIYLAMEFNIVPVNYEWVLNCLGSYSLCSIHELLLCPVSLLPKAVQRWPPALIAREYE